MKNSQITNFLIDEVRISSLNITHLPPPSRNTSGHIYSHLFVSDVGIDLKSIGPEEIPVL